MVLPKQRRYNIPSPERELLQLQPTWPLCAELPAETEGQSSDSPRIVEVERRSRRNAHRLDPSGQFRRDSNKRPFSPHQCGHASLCGAINRGEGHHRREHRKRRDRGFPLHLINSALIRGLSSERVFLLNRQSMSIQVFIHTMSKRAETPALLDSGATENFINHQYATHLQLPTKRLEKARKVYNVDGTLNKKGDILFYTDLKVRTRQKYTNMRFFLTDLGPQRLRAYPATRYFH
jgi:hypothetical protein